MADENIVKVGCRIGNGVVLRVFDWFDSLEAPGTKALREIGIINLAGPVADHGEKTGMPQPQTVNDVDADLFDKWWATNQTSDLVTGGAIYKIEDDQPDQLAAVEEHEPEEEEHEPLEKSED